MPWQEKAALPRGFSLICFAEIHIIQPAEKRRPKPGQIRVLASAPSPQGSNPPIQGHQKN